MGVSGKAIDEEDLVAGARTVLLTQSQRPRRVSGDTADAHAIGSSDEWSLCVHYGNALV